MNKTYLRSIFLTFFILFTLNSIFSQTNISVKALKVEEKYTALNDAFFEYEVYKLDSKNIKNYLIANNLKGEVNLTLNEKMSWTLFLESANMMGGNLNTDVWDGEKVVTYKREFDPTFKGVSNQGADVRLTIDENYFSGSIKSKKQEWMIQPLRDYVANGDASYIIIYDVKKVKPTALGTCGIDEIEKRTNHIHHNIAKNTANKVPLACYEVGLASCTDFSFYTKYGSTTIGAQNRVLTIMNLVEGNYASSFTHTLKFVVARWFVSASATEPWSNQTDAGLLLDEFVAWANATLTGAPVYDIGQFWTNRDLAGSTIGVAYVGAVCSSFRYQCLQDFTSGTDLMRVMVAHETGHNFDCNHDASGSPTIMAPAVSSTNAWSTASVNDVNAYLPSIIGSTCLTPCPAGPVAVANFTFAPSTACINTTVNFTNTSTNSPTSYAWTFQGGTPSTSTATNPSVTWATAGTYGITLTATNANGSSIKTSTITINGAPTPNFTFTTTGLQATFTNTSTNATSYSWAFGDGGTSTANNPTHTYLNYGTYNVTLTATNACGTQSTVKQLILASTISANFSANTTSGCAPFTTTFSNSSSGATSYSWNMPGATPSTSVATNPTVTYSTAGTYSVTLTAINGTSNVSSVKTNYITVNAAPVPNFQYSISGNTVNFANTTSGATSYSWNFGNSTTSTNVAPSVTYAGPGTYIVTLTASNACGQSSTSQTITIVAPPIASFSYGNASGCTPLVVQFSNNSSGATSYLWTFTGGNPATSTDVNPSVTYSTAGTYSVSLKATNAGGSSTYSLNDIIVASQGASANFTSTVNGKIANFTNTSSNATSYLWSFGDGLTSTVASPTHTYLNDGAYSVTLTATSSCGSVNIVKTVNIVTPPTASFTLPIATACAPFTLTPNNTSSSNATSFKWTFTGATPSTSTVKNPSVVYSNAGSFSIKLVVTNAGGKDSMTINNAITINTKPTTSFNSVINSDVVTFTNSSTNANSYAWSFGDGNTSSDQNPVHTYSNDGTYSVTLTATNNCGAVDYVKSITIVTPPTASFSVQNNIGCNPLTVDYENNSSQNATTYSWSFIGATPSSSTDKNPTVTYNNAGSFDAILVVSNAAGKDTFKMSNAVVVNSKPQTAFSKVIDKAKVTFTNTTINSTNYKWYFGNGDSSIVKDPTYTFPNDGTYNVILTSTNACGSTSYTESVTIVSEPIANFTLNQSSGCLPFTANFTNISSNNALNYAWTFAGGNPSTSTAKNPTVIYSQVGAYDVTLIVSNSLYSDTISMKNAVTTVSKPTADFTNTVNNFTANFTNTSLGGNSYNWDFGDNTLSQLTNPTHIYTKDGTYTVKLLVTSACGTDSIAKTITIVSLPKASFSVLSGTGCTPFKVNFTNNSSANSASYEWLFDGGNPNTSTDKNPSVVYSTAGVFNVRLIVTNSAGKDTLLIKKYITTENPPKPSFTKKLTNGTVQFTNTSLNAQSYKWNFGDGNTSTDENPLHTYAKSGKYYIELQATNTICGTISIKDTITLELINTSDELIFNDLQLFPNPNQGQFNLLVKGVASSTMEVIIQNSLGQNMEKRSFDFTNGTLNSTFDTTSLPAGSYILQVIQGNKKAYLKFVKI